MSSLKMPDNPLPKDHSVPGLFLICYPSPYISFSPPTPSLILPGVDWPNHFFLTILSFTFRRFHPKSPTVNSDTRHEGSELELGR